MARIITASLNRELLRNWAAIVLILWVVLLSARLSVYFTQAGTGQFPGSLVLALAALKSVGFAAFVMPLALFLALLMVLGRWNRDMESLALAMSGFSLAGYIRSLLPAMFLVAILTAVLTLFVVPHTAQEGYRLRAQASEMQDMELWRAGRFVSFQNGRLLLFADALADDGETLENIFVRFTYGSRPGVVSAARARRLLDDKSGDRYIVLENGYRYDGQPGEVDYRVLKFQQYSIRLGASSADIPFKWDAVSTKRLWAADEREAAAELQVRLSRPLSVIVLVLSGVMLGRFLPGKGLYGGLIAGILIFIVYFNLTGTARVWVADGSLHVLPGLWWVHIVPLCIVWVLDRFQRVWQYRWRQG